MDEIKELKVQIFDILAHQEQLAYQNQQLEQMKQELVRKLQEATQKGAEIVEVKP